MNTPAELPPAVMDRITSILWDHILDIDDEEQRDAFGAALFQSVPVVMADAEVRLLVAGPEGVSTIARFAGSSIGVAVVDGELEFRDAS